MDWKMIWLSVAFGASLPWIFKAFAAEWRSSRAMRAGLTPERGRRRDDLRAQCRRFLEDHHIVEGSALERDLVEFIRARKSDLMATGSDFELELTESAIEDDVIG